MCLCRVSFKIGKITKMNKEHSCPDQPRLGEIVLIYVVLCCVQRAEAFLLICVPHHLQIITFDTLGGKLGC